ncbi:MAG: exo-alpha-sialidase, partial [Chloroflexota bacterium]|nr:exo-alpha-sialidase [Chloroflexota bacterium]
DPDLQGRAQAQNETAIAQDPRHPDHLLASFNDYRRGDGNCYGAYSLDGGKNWTDTTIPMGFTRGAAFGGAAREYWGSGGDTAVAYDTKGNAYFQCQVFNRGKSTTSNPDASSAVYVFRSTGNFGASWNFPARPVIEFPDLTGKSGVLEDKPYMTVDDHVGSPFADRVYVTYTEFAADGSAYIWESFSADYGEHFSPRVLVSADSALCVTTFGAGTPHGKCNENQFSQPFTGTDGALYVAYANFNNATKDANDNHNQMLLAKSTDGGQTFGAPVKVADYYDLPDCATYQGGKDAGRACVPEKGSGTNSIFRATNYPAGAANPTNGKQVVVTFGSYINVHSNEANGCTPAGFAANGINLYTGVKTAGACNNDILLSVSNDGGATFTGTTTDPRKLTSVTTEHGQATTDQWWQWAAFTKSGKLAVSYYDRQYGDDETTGFSDISLSGADDLAEFGVRRVTGASMPPPTQFGGVFLGDYTGLTAVDDAHPIWMDTRSPDLFLCPGTGVVGTPPKACTSTDVSGVTSNDQDIFTKAVDVPSR